MALDQRDTGNDMVAQGNDASLDAHESVLQRMREEAMYGPQGKKMSLDKTLRTLLREIECAGKYGEVHEATFTEIANQIKAAFTEAGYIHIGMSLETQAAIANTMLGNEVMTGQEWYDRFIAEYHNKADWINSDPTMGDDAEHDVLLCARLASNLDA